MRSPRPPEERREGDHDRREDTGDDADERDPGEADDRQPGLGRPKPDEPERARQIDQRGRSDDDDGAEGGLREVARDAGRDKEQRDDRDRRDDAGHLRLASGGLGDGGPRRAGTHRESRCEGTADIRGAERDQLLVLIHPVPGPRGEGPREHAGVGQRHDGDREAPREHRRQVAETDSRDRQPRQALRHRTDHVHARRGQTGDRGHDGRGDRGQDDPHRGAVDEPRDDHDGQRRDAHAERQRMRIPVGHALGEGDRLRYEAIGVRREPEELRQLRNDDGQRDPVEIADPDRGRQQVGQQTEVQETERDPQ